MYSFKFLVVCYELTHLNMLFIFDQFPEPLNTRFDNFVHQNLCSGEVANVFAVVASPVLFLIHSCWCLCFFPWNTLCTTGSINDSVFLTILLVIVSRTFFYSLMFALQYSVLELPWSGHKLSTKDGQTTIRAHVLLQIVLKRFVSQLWRNCHRSTVPLELTTNLVRMLTYTYDDYSQLSTR